MFHRHKDLIYVQVNVVTFASLSPISRFPDAYLLLGVGRGALRRARDLARERPQRELLPQQAQLHLLATTWHASKT